MAEMKLILARLLWTFDMTLPAEHREWGENLEIYHLWELPPLEVQLVPAAEPVHRDSPHT